MAFTYRTPAELFLSTLPKDYAESCYQKPAERFQKQSDENIGLFNYQCSSSVKERLTKAGVPISAFLSEVHSHPASKMIENHLIFNVLPNYLSDRKFRCLSIKDSKLNTLISKGCSLDSYNRLFSCKDTIRYSNGNTRSLEKLISHSRRNRNFFFFDELHYWSMEDLATFLNQVKPTTIIATVVFPVEIFDGETQSLNPELYEFQIDKGLLHFFPDGVTAERYTQPLSCDILKCNRIVTTSGKVYSVELIHSIGANHMLLIQEGSFEVDQVRFFDQSSAVSTRVLFGKRAGRPLRMRRKFLLRLIIYLFSLKKPDHHSAIAKIRQSSDTEIFCDEILLADHIGKVFEKIDPAEPFGLKGFFDLIQRVSKQIFMLDFLGWSDQSKAERFTDFLRSLDRKTMKLRPVTFSGGLLRGNPITDFLFDNDTSTDESLEEVLERFDIFSRGRLSFANSDALRTSREPQPYHNRHSRSIMSFYRPPTRTPVAMRSKNKKYNELKNEFMEISFEEGRALAQTHVLTFDGFIPVCYPKLLITLVDNQKLFHTFNQVLEIEMEDAFEEPLEGSDYSDMDISSPSTSYGPLTRTTLTKGEVEPKDVNFQKVGKRLCAFFSKAEWIDYSHDVVVYERHNWYRGLELLEEELGMETNACLVQIYPKGAGIPFHRDDEHCYDDDPIVTVNYGLALFEFSNGTSYHLTDGDVLTMSGEMLKLKHRVTALEENRMSFTFRLHKRSMFGSPSSDYDLASTSFSVSVPDIQEVLKKGGKRMCLLVSLGTILNLDIAQVLALLVGADATWADWFSRDLGASFDDVINAVQTLGIRCTLIHEDSAISVGSGDFKNSKLYLQDGHVSVAEPGSLSKEVVPKKNALELFSKCPGASMINWEPCFEAAMKLMKSLQNERTGVISSKFHWKLERNLKCPAKIPIVIVTGFAGSGKSRAVMVTARALFNEKTTLVISPRVNLAGDWERGLLDSDVKTKIHVKTFETGIQQIEGKEVVIIDELGLCPNGFLDLCCSLNPKANFICLFDPLQARYHPTDDILTLHREHEIDRMKIEKYLFFSQRISKELDFFEVKFLSSAKKWEHHNKRIGLPQQLLLMLKGESYAILSPSFKKAREMTRFAPESQGCVSMTIGESQGLTFNKVVIVIDLDVLVTSDLHWIVALTRAREGFMFLIDGICDLKAITDQLGSRIIGKVLCNKPVTDRLLKSTGGKCLIDAELIREPENNFCDSRSLSDECKLEGDPWLKGQLFLCESVEELDAEPYEEVRHESPPRTHLPVAVASALPLAMSEIKAREDREFISCDGWSHQFRDDNFRIDWRNVSLCDAFETIYPKHNASDDITLWAAIRKRILKGDPIRNALNLQRCCDVSKVLFDELNSVLNLNPFVKVDQDVIYSEFLKARLNKSKNLIEAHCERSSPDWPLDHFFLFMKSQLCTKFEKRFVDAKAGQTLACFSHHILTRFGPAFREFEKKFSANLPKSWYVHTMKNFDQLNDWVTENVTESFGTESDYEAFDRSQDHCILGFELLLLEHFGWDQDLIEDYKKIKLWMGCRLGAIAIMRFTGEFGTFFFNTLANMAFTCLRYKISRDTVIAFAGDDMFAMGRLPLRYDREDVLNRLELKAKVDFKENPMFCGWYIKPEGIVKEPRLVLERWMIAERKGVLDQCFINYSIEHSFGYRLGEHLWKYFDNLEDFQAITRLVIKKKKELPRKIRLLFETADGSDTCEQIQERLGDWTEHHTTCGLWCHLH